MRNLLLAAFCGILMLQTACNQDKAVKTEHGHRLIQHTKGAGPKVLEGEMISFHVDTYLRDTMMASTHKQGRPYETIVPTKDKLKERFPAVLDAIFMMTKGDSVTLFETIDSVMAKGMPPGFENVKEIRYEIYLVDQTSKADADKKVAEEKTKAEAAAAKSAADAPRIAGEVNTVIADYKAHKLGAKLQKTASGLEYVIHEMGTGAQLKKGEQVPTNYYGALLKDGAKFDDSYSRGGPAPFTIGQMIPGFDEGLMLLNHGSKATLFIPWQLAYGEQGMGDKIGPKSNLVFYVEVE